jgi:hypothetical protein
MRAPRSPLRRAQALATPRVPKPARSRVQHWPSHLRGIDAPILVTKDGKTPNQRVRQTPRDKYHPITAQATLSLGDIPIAPTSVASQWQVGTDHAITRLPAAESDILDESRPLLPSIPHLVYRNEQRNQNDRRYCVWRRALRPRTNVAEPRMLRGTAGSIYFRGSTKARQHSALICGDGSLVFPAVPARLAAQ